MIKQIAYFEYGQVYPPPLVDGAPPVVTPEPVAQPARAGTPWWALAWYIVHVALIGAAYITLVREPLELTYPTMWQEVALGMVALLLWGITLTVSKVARRRANA